MEKIVFRVRNCLAEVLNYFLFVAVEIAVFSTFQVEKAGFFTLLMLGFVPIFFYFVRITVYRLWLFSILHLLPLPMIFFGFQGNVAYQSVFLFVAVIQIFVSFAIKIAGYTNPERSGYGIVVALPWIVIAVLAATYFASGDLAIAFLAIAYVAIYFIYLYAGYFLYYIDMSRRSIGDVPKGNILGVNLLLVSSFTLVAVFFMAFAAGRDVLAGYGRMIAGYIIRFLSWLFSLWTYEIPENTDVVEPVPLPVQGPSEMEILEEMGLLDAEPAKLWLLLETVLLGAATVAIVALAAWGIYSLAHLIIVSFRQRAGRGTADDDKEKEDVVEKLTRPARAKKSGAIRRLFRTNDEKIRRLFLSVMAARMKKTRINKTARELLLLCGEGAEQEAFTGLYEKARYAQESCTGADVIAAKKLAKKLINPVANRNPERIEN